ncbi:Diphthine methyltransferase [Lobulomyces angularis]|nr:Diphthine methyltransferase [Lobulomyces angularis]
MSLITEKLLFDTEKCADTVEFNPFEEVVVVGTYDLNNGVKTGSLHYFKKNDKCEWFQDLKLNTNAVLDMKWSHNDSDKSILAVGDVNGLLNFYSDGKLLASHSNNRNTINLSLDWSNRIDKSSSPKIVVSESDGSLSIKNMTSYNVTETLNFKAHTFEGNLQAEAWIAAFNYHNTNLFYSGGDDANFFGWDLRTKCFSAVFRNRQHESGVTAIQTNPHDEFLLATGSYDENLRIWDTRYISSKSEPLTNYHVGDGGVWRVKWHPIDKTKLLAACMHDGFRILSVEDIAINTIYKYMKHQSLAYGADWNYFDYRNGKLTVDKDVVGTCSFYDKEFRMWEIIY